MRNKKVLLIVQAALIAAIYVVLTYFISAFNLYRMPVKQSAHRLHAA